MKFRTILDEVLYMMSAIFTSIIQYIWYNDYDIFNLYYSKTKITIQDYEISV
jgi:hypothetical protein